MTKTIQILHDKHAWIQMGGQGSGPRTLKNHKAIGFLSNTDPDPMKKNQSYKSSIQCRAIIGPPDNGPVFGSFLPSSLKKTTTKNNVRVGPLLTKLSGSAHGKSIICTKTQQFAGFAPAYTLIPSPPRLLSLSRAIPPASQL